MWNTYFQPAWSNPLTLDINLDMQVLNALLKARVAGPAEQPFQ